MAIKLKYEGNIGYQIHAVNSIVKLFEGQPLDVARTTMTHSPMHTTSGKQKMLQDLAIISNSLYIPDETILSNLQRIQDENDLPVSKSLDGLDFTIEMETGTGKTYVFLRTIFELNKQYGFKKFIIVVPSIAIKEGVKKTLETTEDHFKSLYSGIPFKFYVYDSSNTNNIVDFSRSNALRIMVINIDSFKKDLESVNDPKKSNLIYRERDSIHGTPIEYIRKTNPILIIDEPQITDNTDNAKDAINRLNPAFKLRYSATHKQDYNQVYRLTPKNAFDMGLVKKIELDSVSPEADVSTAFVELLGVKPSKGKIQARIRILVKRSEGIRSEEIVTKRLDNLYLKSGELDAYKHGFVIDDITYDPDEPEKSFIRFENGKEIIIGGSIAGNREAIVKAQIKATIREHFDKEISRLSKGIKVLSLFFIDKVANYRQYDENGNKINGRYAQLFEETFNELISLAKYREHYEKHYKNHRLAQLHDGYFSIDRKGHEKDSKGKSELDNQAYEKIMQNKEQLLDLKEPLRFIFSHSALNEGWDNPNIFQICFLRDVSQDYNRRQMIGRGLRLPVNQNSDRIYESNINKLTVIADESYDYFLKRLQKNYEDDGFLFGVIESSDFKKIMKIIDGNAKPLSSNERDNLLFNLKSKGIIDENNQLTDLFKPDELNFKLNLSPSFSEYEPEIIDILRSKLLSQRVDNKANRCEARINHKLRNGQDFKNIWNKIKNKSAYELVFSVDRLIDNSAEEIRNRMQKISPMKIKVSKANVKIENKGISGTTVSERSEGELAPIMFPDPLTEIGKETNLTRKTIARILKASARFDEFFENPQMFITEISKHINRIKTDLFVKGAKYYLENEEQQAHFDSVIQIPENKISSFESINCLYDAIEKDSTIEESFALALSKRTDISLFFKIPRTFKILTPINDGEAYTPDWAIVKNDDEKIYLVRETKGSKNLENLRITEDQKIFCGHKHFEALGTGIDYKMIKDSSELS